MPPHILYRCSAFVCILNTGRKTDVILKKKHRACVLLNILFVAILAGLPVAVNNPVAASQVGLQQFRAI